MPPYTFCALGSLYDGEDPTSLELCLDSVKNQSLKIPVYLVIDGEIRTELELVLRKFSCMNIVFIRNPDNSGLASALQSGLMKIAHLYDYVIRFDSDDINMPNRFEKICNYINENEPDLVSSHMYEIDENGNVFSKRKVPLGVNKIKKTIPYRNPINHPASAFKVKSVMASGGYKKMPYFEDWYLWIRIFNAGYRIENIDDFLVSFRATDAMVARRYGLRYIFHEAYFFYRRGHENLINPIENISALILRFIVKIFGFRVYKKIFYWIRK